MSVYSAMSIVKMPSEVLEKIFQTVILIGSEHLDQDRPSEVRSYPKTEPRRKRATHSLVLVCSRWRSIIDCGPTFWRLDLILVLDPTAGTPPDYDGWNDDEFMEEPNFEDIPGYESMDEEMKDLLNDRDFMRELAADMRSINDDMMRHDYFRDRARLPLDEQALRWKKAIAASKNSSIAVQIDIKVTSMDLMIYGGLSGAHYSLLSECISLLKGHEYQLEKVVIKLPFRRDITSLWPFDCMQSLPRLKSLTVLETCEIDVLGDPIEAGPITDKTLDLRNAGQLESFHSHISDIFQFAVLPDRIGSVDIGPIDITTEEEWNAFSAFLDNVTCLERLSLGLLGSRIVPPPLAALRQVSPGSSRPFLLRLYGEESQCTNILSAARLFSSVSELDLSIHISGKGREVQLTRFTGLDKVAVHFEQWTPFLENIVSDLLPQKLQKLHLFPKLHAARDNNLLASGRRAVFPEGELHVDIEGHWHPLEITFGRSNMEHVTSLHLGPRLIGRIVIPGYIESGGQTLKLYMPKLVELHLQDFNGSDAEGLLRNIHAPSLQRYVNEHKWQSLFGHPFAYPRPAELAAQPLPPIYGTAADVKIYIDTRKNEPRSANPLLHFTNAKSIELTFMAVKFAGKFKKQLGELLEDLISESKPLPQLRTLSFCFVSLGVPREVDIPKAVIKRVTKWRMSQGMPALSISTRLEGRQRK